MAIFLPTQVYVPGTWVSQPDLFVGRIAELRQASSALETPGMNLIIYGHRGLGKTTFIHHATMEREDNVQFLDCGSTYTLETFVGRILKKLDIELVTTTKVTTAAVRGGVGGKIPLLVAGSDVERRSTSSYVNFPDAIYSADYFCDRLMELSRPTILVLDEFDALKGSGDYRRICSFLVEVMKACARRASERDSLVFKLVIVGVGTSVGDLIGEHGSIERNFVEIEIGKIEHELIGQFLRLAEHYTDFVFDPSVRLHFIEQADGYPFFIHKLGLESCLEAKQRRTQAISWEIYEDAFDVCYDQVSRSYAARYKKNDRTLSAPEKAVLLGVCLESSPTVTLKRIHDKIIKPINDTRPDESKFSLDDLELAANRLVRDKLYLFRIRSSDRIGFIDPIMKVFFRERYFLRTQDLSHRKRREITQRLRENRIGRQSDLFDAF